MWATYVGKNIGCPFGYKPIQILNEVTVKELSLPRETT
jgi:hypothetical protein